MICENKKCNTEHDGSFGSGRFCSRVCSNTRVLSEKTKSKISKSLVGHVSATKNLKLNLSDDIKLEKSKRLRETCKAKRETFINKWLNGEISGNSISRLSIFIRDYLFDKYNNKCQRCRWGVINVRTNKVPLQIHHKDGDCGNSSFENLELLCPNCHSLTDNFGYSLNRKNFDANKKSSGVNVNGRRKILKDNFN